MNGSFILDTNIVIALFANDEAVAREVSKTSALYLAAIVTGELLYGVFNSGNLYKNTPRITGFISDVIVLKCAQEAGKFYER